MTHRSEGVPWNCNLQRIVECNEFRNHFFSRGVFTIYCLGAVCINRNYVALYSWRESEATWDGNMQRRDKFSLTGLFLQPKSDSLWPGPASSDILQNRGICGCSLHSAAWMINLWLQKRHWIVIFCQTKGTQLHNQQIRRNSRACA